MAITLLGVLSASCLVGLAPVQAGSGARAEPSLYVVIVGSQSMPEAILANAARDDDFLDVALSMARLWRASSQLGEPLAGLGESPFDQRQTVEWLLRNLKKLKAGQAADVGLDPNALPVRGSAGSGNLVWQGMQLIVAGRICTPSGCETKDSDRVTSRVTVNPGAVTSKLSIQTIHSPDGGGFGEMHFQFFAINKGKVTNTRDSVSQDSGPFTTVFGNDADLNGTVLTVAVNLWVFANYYGTYVSDGAKTADAKCSPKPDNECKY